MLFFAARVVRHPAVQNLTLVVLTNRNDLTKKESKRHLNRRG